jgi:hypothetical protein
MKSPEQFDPKDPKYKKVADLPEEKQDAFANVADGFITKKAADYDTNNKETANRLNKWYWAGGSRTNLEMLKGTGKMSEVDIAEDDARIENEHKDEDKADSIAAISHEKYLADRWDAFDKTDVVMVSHRLDKGIGLIDGVLVRDKRGKEFRISLKELEKKGLIRAAQFTDLYNIEAKINDSGVFFSEKIKDGWEQGLEKILGKKVQVEISKPIEENLESTYLGTSPKRGNAIYAFGPKKK